MADKGCESLQAERKADGRPVGELAVEKSGQVTRLGRELLDERREPAGQPGNEPVCRPPVAGACPEGVNRAHDERQENQCGGGQGKHQVRLSGYRRRDHEHGPPAAVPGHDRPGRSERREEEHHPEPWVPGRQAGDSGDSICPLRRFLIPTE